MLVCDRCGKTIPYKNSKYSEVTVRICSTEESHSAHHVNLCDDCKKIFNRCRVRMDSYFMTHADPLKLFNDKVYWDKNKKFKKSEVQK